MNAMERASYQRARKRQIEKISWSLLAAGNLNTKTGKSTHFSVLDNPTGTLVLMRNHAGKFFVASSAGGKEWLEKETPVNTDKLITSYLTGRQMELRLVIGYYPSTEIGLKQINSATGQTSISFSVFK